MSYKIHIISLVLLFFPAVNSFATIYQVGSKKSYISPNALYLANVIQEGDTIEIDAEEFRGQTSLAVWYPDNLLIRGVEGRPHLIAEGAYIMQKGIWVLAGNNITVENIEFSGAKVPDKNGAGIRLDGTGMTVRNCSFHNNEDGILTSNPYDGEILIEYTEFANNGYENGYSHNLYVGHVNTLIFRFNNTHHAKVGHAIKSRAQNNFIYYNRIMDEETGYSSRLIDLPNGGFAIIMGNLIMQSVNGINSNMVGYGPEGLENEAPHELYVINNTFVNKRMASCLFISIKEGTSVANISNNIFTGGGTLYSGTATIISNNLVEPTIENIHFSDEANFNYKINSNSPAINYGSEISPVYGYSLTPNSIYKHPTNFGLRNIINDIDAGAYEFQNATLVEKHSKNHLKIYPNPTDGIVTFQYNINNIKKIIVFDSLGKQIFSVLNSNQIDLSKQKTGTYFLNVELKNGESYQKKIMINR